MPLTLAGAAAGLLVQPLAVMKEGQSPTLWQGLEPVQEGGGIVLFRDNLTQHPAVIQLREPASAPPLETLRQELDCAHRDQDDSVLNSLQPT